MRHPPLGLGCEPGFEGSPHTAALDPFEGNAGGIPSVPMRAQRSRGYVGWLGRPLSQWWCALGWLTSTAVFVGLVQALGGPYVIDSASSVDSTLALANGQAACAFPSGTQLQGPLYSFFSAGVAAADRLGSAIRFPPGSASQRHCAQDFQAINAWIGRAHTWSDLLRIGYLAWLFLLVGLILVLRAGGRGRCGWEPATLIVVACLPPVWLTLESSFHPQDLVAMGLGLCAMACGLRGRWLISGIFVALAVFSQEFTLLVAVPLLFLAPRDRRLRYVIGALGTAAAATLILLVVSSTQALSNALSGTIYLSTTDTFEVMLHLHGRPQVFLSRLVPVLLAGLISWWVLWRRRGGSAPEATTMVALVALCLSLRLVFEQNIFGYYFMALAVALVVLDVFIGRVRSALVAWLLLLSLTYLAGATTTFVQLSRVSWGADAREWMTPVVLALAVVMILWCVRRRAPTSDLLVWLVLLIGAVLIWPSTRNPVSLHISSLWWQLLFVGTGIALAAGPLFAGIRAEPASRTVSAVSPHAGLAME